MARLSRMRVMTGDDNRHRWRISYGEIIKYVIYFAMMTVLAFARTEGGIAPFNLGLFVALVYCRENIFLLSVEYIMAMIIADMTLYTLIVAIVPCAVFIIAKNVHKLIARPMKLLHTNIYAAVCQIPILAMNIMSVEKIISALSSVIISQIFTYCSVIIAYAVVVRGARYRFTRDELFGAGMMIAGLSAGLHAIDIFGFKPFYLIAPFVLLLTVYSGKMNVSLLVALAMGIGAGFMRADIMITGGLLLCVSLAMIFMNSNIYFAAVTYMLADIFVGVYFKAFGSYGYQHLIMTSISVLAFVVLPKYTREYIVQSFGGGECNAPERAMVNRNRRDVSAKLNNMSRVFTEISRVIGGIDYRSSAVSSIGLAREIVSDYCSGCQNAAFCANMLGGDIAPGLQSVIEKALVSKTITAADLPPFIAARCIKSGGLIEMIMDRSERLSNTVAVRNQIGAGRLILGEQLAGLGDLLSQLAYDVAHSVFFDSECEKRILDEFAYRNIVARDIIVSGENGGYGVTVTLRKGDVDKPAMSEVIGNVLGNKFEIVERTDSEIVGYDTLRLQITPKYSVIYGIAREVMKGSNASGDSYSVDRIGYDKVMVALCDGMGSGRDANVNSESTISMIENFYRAGFNNNAILSLINKILATFNGERFTCLDMGIIDLSKGTLDIIKLGGVQSIIFRQGVATVVESSSLPFGIVEEAEPFTDRRVLLDGDVLVMFTDGVVDALTIDGICEIVYASRAGNPQVLADEILQKATFGGAGDDSTVIALRIYTKKD